MLESLGLVAIFIIATACLTIVGLLVYRVFKKMRLV